MSRYILEASQHLPADACDGAIVKIPVSMETDQFVIPSELRDNHSIVVYYGFLRTHDEWVSLERSMFA